jgi:hypothetical protein
MTIKEYVVDLIDEHWNECSFENAKKHSLITLKRVKNEANAMLDVWFRECKTLIEKIEITEFSIIKKEMKE